MQTQQLSHNSTLVSTRSLKWRVVDIVVASVVAVACGVIFWAWGVAWNVVGGPFEALLPGLQAAPAGMWLIAGVLGALIIRKPGAALYTEVVAAIVSSLIGSQWGGFWTIEAGLVQGLGAEIVFLLFAYKMWNLPVALLAGAGAGIFMALNDLFLYYAGGTAEYMTIYMISAIVGGALIAGLLSWFAVKALAATGALSRFASGQASTNGGVVSLPARIDARHWGWRHSGRHRPAVSDISFTIEPGERVLLLGASGSGKSTLLHGLAGVLGGDDEGDAFGELNIDSRPSASQRDRVGVVMQDPDAQVILARVGDDVAFGCENLGVERSEIWRRVHESLDAVGLDVPLDRSTAELSGGQKQRLALAGVLAMQPGLLLLDEPTANLDPEGVEEVRDAVGRTLDRTGATLVVIEHRVDVWLPLVDRVIVLDADGGVLADDAPDVVLHRHRSLLTMAGIWVPGYTATQIGAGNGNGEPLVEARDLDISRQRDVLIRSGINLSVASGEIVALTGANGTGKSTFALTAAGLLPPGGGELIAHPRLADGQTTSPVRWKSRALLSRIGTVFQDPEHQFLTGRVRDELAVGPRALKLGAAETSARVDELLDRLRLTRLADANPFTLSGGEKRRLSVATVLATRPRLLVLDEPTFGQDLRTWNEMVSLIGSLRDDGCGILAVTHDREFAVATAARQVAFERKVQAA